MNTIAQIIYDNYKGEIPAEFSAKTKKEREDMIRAKIFEVMGLDGYTDSKTFRRAWSWALWFNLKRISTKSSNSYLKQT